MCVSPPCCSAGFFSFIALGLGLKGNQMPWLGEKENKFVPENLLQMRLGESWIGIA
jgi:hypothetical protein